MCNKGSNFCEVIYEWCQLRSQTNLVNLRDAGHERRSGTRPKIEDQRPIFIPDQINQFSRSDINHAGVRSFASQSCSLKGIIPIAGITNKKDEAVLK